jgi:molybdopterin synthase sulfur carrier subunit
MIRVLYFASLREQLGSAGETLELPPGVTDLAGLAAYLASRGGIWATVFAGGQPVLMARNQVAAQLATPLADGDELAFFPPVTGG